MLSSAQVLSAFYSTISECSCSSTRHHRHTATSSREELCFLPQESLRKSSPRSVHPCFPQVTGCKGRLKEKIKKYLAVSPSLPAKNNGGCGRRMIVEWATSRICHVSHIPSHCQRPPSFLCIQSLQDYLLSITV